MKRIFSRFITKIRRNIPLNSEFRSEYKRILLTFQITSVAAIAVIFFAIVDLIFLNYWGIFLDILTLFMYSLSIFLVTKGKFGMGKLIIVLISCITLLLNASRDGRLAGNEFIWFPIFGAIFLFFSAKEKGYIIGCFTLAFGAIVFLEYTDYSYFLIGKKTDHYNYINFSLCFTVSITLICLFMYYLKKINTESERKLERLNRILVNRNLRLNKTNSELDSFVYKASHDMRAPLTSLLGLIEICKKEKDITVLAGFLALQEKSIKKLDSYISDILDISRNARVEVSHTEVNFKEMIEQLLDQLSFMENSHRVKKEISVYDTVPFLSDPIRLTILFNNILSNSIRYSDLKKEQCLLSIAVKVNLEQAELVIRDNGIGIGKGHLKKVFTMFYRANDINSGSGLGLYIVQETVAKLNGLLTIDSVEGEYTEIKITLPNSTPVAGLK